MNFDLRDSEDEQSMRMLNALEPGTDIPVHRHTMTSEDVVVIRGSVEEIRSVILEFKTTRYDKSLSEEFLQEE